MDLAFIYILVSFITLLIKVAFFIVASFSIFVVGFVGRDVYRMITERKERRGNRNQ